MSREAQVFGAPKGQGQPGFRHGLAHLRIKFGGTDNRSPILFTGSSITLSVAQMLAGLLTVHLISPRDMGLWSSVNLVLTYAFFVLAGVQNGLSRELPYYLGAKNESMARRLAATALYYTAAGGLLAVLAGFGAVLFLATTGAESKLIYSIAAIALLVLFRFYQNYLFITFRSKDSFLALAGVQGWQALLMIVTVPILFLGYGGLLGRAVLVAGLGLYLMHRARPLSVMPVWKTDSFLLLFRTGVPIFATDYVSSCAGTLDKVALLRFGGVEQVGLYALAMSAYTAFAVIPQSIAHYIYPRMSHHYGRTHNPRVLWTLAWKTNVVIVVSMIPIALAGSMLLPIFIKLLFPKYLAGTHAAQVALFTAIAYGATIGANALNSLKAWSSLIAFQLSYAGFLAIGPFLGIRFFASPIDGVAYGMLAANVLGAIVSLTITFIATHRQTRPIPDGFAGSSQTLEERVATN